MQDLTLNRLVISFQGKSSEGQSAVAVPFCLRQSWRHVSLLADGDQGSGSRVQEC
jgi:hypothetical protein